MCWGAQHHASCFSPSYSRPPDSPPPALAAAAPPANDAYLASLPVDKREFTASTDTTEATTQADLFNPSRDGAPLGGAGPENTTCKGTPFGKTVWYDLAPQVDGGVVIRATGFATVVAVYEWSGTTSQITRMVDCSANASVDDLVLDVRGKRNYTIQVGGADGIGGPLNLKVDYFPDRDRDCQIDDLDRCPTVAGIERFGGCPPELSSRPRLTFANTASGIRITRLWVDRVPKGGESGRPLRRLRFADRHGPAHRHRRALTLCGPRRQRRRHDLGEGDDGPQRHRDLPLRRDRQVPVLAGARRRHQGVARTLSERPHGEVRALLVRLRVLVCAVFAVLASAAPAQAQLETPPTVIPFQDGHTPPVRSGAGAVLATDCGDRTVASGGWDGGTYLVLGVPVRRS